MAAKLLRWFAFVWFTLAGGVIFVSCAALWYTEGFSKVQEVFSPFNLANFVVTLVTLGPGIGAYVLADRLEQRADTRTIDAAVARANELVQSYGRALEAAASTKGMVADSDRLPAPKDEIKAALFVALRVAARGRRELRRHPDSRTS